jgi:hypothetical protein
MQVKGRYLVIGWTAVFLAAVGAIVIRDGAGFTARKNLDKTNREVTALEGIRGNLETSISQLSAREALRLKVQPFGLRPPTDSESVQIQLPARP